MSDTAKKTLIITTTTGAALPLGERTKVGDLFVTPTVVLGKMTLAHVEGPKGGLKEARVRRDLGAAVVRCHATVPNWAEGRGGFFSEYCIPGVARDEKGEVFEGMWHRETDRAQVDLLRAHWEDVKRMSGWVTGLDQSDRA